VDQRKSAANLFFLEAPFCPLSFRLSGSLLFSGSLMFFGLRPAGMMAREAGLKVFDLLLDLLFAFASLKENVIRVAALLLEFAAMPFPGILGVLLIAL